MIKVVTSDVLYDGHVHSKMPRNSIVVKYVNANLYDSKALMAKYTFQIY